MKEVNDLLDSKTYTKLKYFFFSVGCNDVEYKSGVEVFDDIRKTVERIQNEYPHVKVILSEITPRMDDDGLDREVKDCNKLLNDYVNVSETIFIARNSNLRDRKFFLPDGKHLKQNSIARFASNIKWALRRAYGIRLSNGNQRYERSYQQERATDEERQDNARSNRETVRGFRNWRDTRPQSFNPNDLWNPVPMPTREQLVEIFKRFT